MSVITSRCHVIAASLLFSLVVLAVAKNQHLTQTVDLDLEQKNALGEVMRKMIGLKAFPLSSGDRDELKQSSAATAGDVQLSVPHYMRRLYDQYQNGRMYRDADKVRSIHSKLEIISNTSFIVFNLSSIDASAESLIAGQFHVYRKYFEPPSVQKKHRRRSPPNNAHLRAMTSSEHRLTSPISNAPDVGDETQETRLNVFDVSAPYIRQVASLALSRSTRSGWHSVDVTSIIREIRFARSETSLNEPRLIAVRLEHQADECTSLGPPSSDCHPRLSRLALLVFTKKHQKLHPPESHQIHVPRRRQRRDIVPDDVLKSGSTRVRSGVQRASRTAETALFQTRNVHENSVDFGDNAKQEDSDEIIAKHNLPPRATSRRVMQTSVSRQRSQHQHLLKSTPTAESLSSFTIINDTVNGITTKESTDSPPSRAGNSRRRFQPPPRYSKKRPPVGAAVDDDHQSLLLPDPSEYVELGGTTFWNDDVDDGLCKRHRLMVDFADIGWTEAIISPMSFEAFYCDGQCRFPIPKKLRPTNHASIQSIVRAVGIHTSVPSPCCVPSSLKSLNLLYFDENRDIVLGNFPDMSVTSCACR